MERFFFVACLCLLILTQTLIADFRPGEMKIRLDNVSFPELKQLDRMGFLLEDYYDGSLYLLVVPSELDRLQKMGYEPRIVIEDMNAYRQEIMSSPDYVQYHDYNSTMLLVDSLINAYPNLIEKHHYGYSVQGRQLYAVKISDNVSVNEYEPSVSFDGGHHGDEIMGAEVLILMMRDLCVQYGSDPQITDLVNNREVWIFPFVNPDGRQSLNRTNANNVDVNRDWGYMWDHEGSSPGAFSQPESQAAGKWILENHFVISQSNHGGTEAISYPWSYRPNQSPDHNPIHFLAAGYSSSSGYASLQYFQGYNGMYPINGSAKDAFYGLKGTVGWTMEVSNLKMPPASQIPMYYGWNKPAMLYLIEMASRGVRGMVTDANTGEPIPAIVWVSGGTTEYWPVYTDPQIGDFHKFLLPGTYDVRVTANGYQSMTVTNVTVVDTGAAEASFQLQKAIGTYAYQVISCQIPNNNFNDEGMTPWALGAPDGKNYSIGTNGWVVLDMGAEIYDYPGNDFRVVEGDLSPEGYDVKVSNDWLGPWTYVGSGVGTTEFDLAATGLQKFRYIRVEDDGDDVPNLANAGFDLDAVEGRLIPTSGPYLAATGLTIVDSLSNFNGVLEAGETAYLDLFIQNLGVDPASNVSVKLSSADPNLTVLIDSLYAGFVAAGGSDSLAGFLVQASPNTPHNSQIEVDVRFTADNGYQVYHPLTIPVREGAKIYTQNTHIQFEPTFVNYESTQPLRIFNNGSDTLKIGEFLFGTNFFSVDANQLTIPPGGNATVNVKFTPADTVLYTDTLLISSNDPVQFEYEISLAGEGILQPDIFVNVDSISVTLQDTDSLDFSFSIENIGAGDLTFTNRIMNYSPATANPQRGGGYDAFGHVWSDSDDPNGPTYDWIDISDGSGTEIPISGSNSTSNPISIGFSFPFYENNYSSLRVCTNGWLSFITFSTAYNNSNLPNPLAPKAMIAPLWDNLVFQSSSKAFYRQDADRMIIQWNDVETVSGYGPYTFQALIYDNGDILLQYKELTNIEHAYTVGMQNNDASDGFAIAFDEPYLHEEMSILINRRSWVQVSPSSGQISPGGSQSVSVRFTTDNFPPGDFWAGLEIQSNDPDESTLLIPLHMQVTGPVAVSDQTEVLPSQVALYQNYPNPFNPTTTITFQIPEKAPVRIMVYNPLGQVVKTLVDKELAPGEYQVVWDSTNQFGQKMPSGVYFYQLRTEGFSQIKKMVLLH